MKHIPVFAAALLSLSVAPAYGADMDGPCWTGGEATAARLHGFETMLMVGALKCRSEAPEAIANYNSFAKNRADMIASHAYVLRAHFVGGLGMARGEDAFANYESSLGNYYSSTARDKLDCARISAFSRLASRASEADLAELASAVAVLPPTKCAAGGQPAPEQANLVKAAAENPAPQAILVADNSGLAAKPDQPSAAVASNQAPPNAAEALAEAAKALATAAVALQAARPIAPPDPKL